MRREEERGGEMRGTERRDEERGGERRRSIVRVSVCTLGKWM